MPVGRYGSRVRASATWPSSAAAGSTSRVRLNLVLASSNRARYRSRISHAVGVQRNAGRGGAEFVSTIRSRHAGRLNQAAGLVTAADTIQRRCC